MDYPAIAALLAKLIGLDSSTLGSSGLSHAVRELMKTLNLQSETDYIKLLKKSEEHRKQLIDAVTVPETWFFRDHKSYDCLKTLAAEHIRNNPDKPMEIISLACCSGEEPYSAAITLLDAGVKKKNFNITAIDINPKSLEIATTGIYRKKAFRTLASAPKDYQQRFFEDHGDGTFLINKKIKRCVKFIYGNLAKTNTLPAGHKYDVIFCRNVLIYLTDKARTELTNYIHSSLQDNGVLFVGPSEMLNNDKLRVVKNLYSFAYGKFKPTAPKSKATKKVLPKTTKPRQSQKKVPLKKVRPKVKKISTETQPLAKTTNLDQLLKQAYDLANQGHSSKAAKICEQLTKETTDYTAGAYYLLGVISEAGKDFTAAKVFFRKAIYLQPKHIEALQNLMLLARQEGDKVSELRLLERIERLQHKAESNVK